MFAARIMILIFANSHGKVRHFNQTVLLTALVEDLNPLSRLLNLYKVFLDCFLEVEPVPAADCSLREDIQG